MRKRALKRVARELSLRRGAEADAAAGPTKQSGADGQVEAGEASPENGADADVKLQQKPRSKQNRLKARRWQRLPPQPHARPAKEVATDEARDKVLAEDIAKGPSSADNHRLVA